MPIMPLPTRSMVAGSGTGAGLVTGGCGLIMHVTLLLNGLDGGFGKLPIRSVYGFGVVLPIRHLSFESMFSNLLEYNVLKKDNVVLEFMPDILPKGSA
jgi:hypothetical protein